MGDDNKCCFLFKKWISLSQSFSDISNDSWQYPTASLPFSIAFKCLYIILNYYSEIWLSTAHCCKLNFERYLYFINTLQYCEAFDSFVLFLDTNLELNSFIWNSDVNFQYLFNDSKDLSK